MFQTESIDGENAVRIIARVRQIDVQNRELLAKEMARVFARGDRLELDLEMVQFLDTSAVALLAGMRRVSGPGRFILVGITSRLRQILEHRAPQLLEPQAV